MEFVSINLDNCWFVQNRF